LSHQNLGQEKVRYFGDSSSNMPIKDPEKRKAKQKEYSARYYAQNKKKTIDRVKAVNRRNKTKWNEFKASLSCIICGFSHPAVIDFHHVDPETKTDNVHRLVQRGRYAAAYEEIKKCVALCANCHRIHHHDQHQALKQQRKKAKKKGPGRGP
jgi:NADPH-dependent glutamate synthase beta subunit-like oxidoreductase